MELVKMVDLLDSYPETYRNADRTLKSLHPSDSSNVSQFGQSFTCPGSYKITSAEFFMSKVGSPTGIGHIVLYAHTGTYGVDGIPIGPVLATSDGVDVSTLTYGLNTFTFTGAQQYTMASGAKYCILFENPTSGTIDASNYPKIGMDNSTLMHGGNKIEYNYGSHAADPDRDTCFYVYGEVSQQTGNIIDDVEQITINIIEDGLQDNLLFIHHSCGRYWLAHSLHNALLAKNYIDERNDIDRDTIVLSDSGRPNSLSPEPGDYTDMDHWLFWFNDYLNGIINHDSEDGINKIIMFKSCYSRNVDVVADGIEPGDPFDAYDSIVNHKAIYRHPDGPWNYYVHNGYVYYPLENIFAANPDILFIPVTYPPTLLQGTWPTTLPNAARARKFTNWLATDWINNYNSAFPGLNNVAVFNWFDLLAYPDNHSTYPNILQEQYRTSSTDAHPNALANAESTAQFATNTPNFIDTAWNIFIA